jgi:prepilin-type N-terminal cleavage/methylation domain-containing protein
MEVSPLHIVREHRVSSFRGVASRGFSLVEMLLAVFILGIGVISIAALFPAGIVLQRQANDDILGPVVAKNAFAVIRSKLDQSDFGSIEDFGFSPQYLGLNGIAGTVQPIGGGAIPQVSGDWGWMRPGFWVSNNPAAAIPPYEGTIDVFSAEYTRFNEPIGGLSTSIPLQNLRTDLSADVSPGVLYGIPYNLAKYPLYSRPASQRPTDPLAQQVLEPVVTFTQAERSWPQGNPKYGTASSIPLSTYYWDCMFRKNGGRVQVAVFVYRVNAPGGDSRPYSVASMTNVTGAGGQPGGAFVFSGTGPGSTPPVPAMYIAPVFGGAGSWPNRTPALGAGNTTAMGYSTPPAPNEIPGTGINQANTFGAAEQVWDDWQAPGSWWIDNHGTVHRVLNGRTNVQQGPVRLARPVPILPRSPVNGYPPTASGNGPNSAISAIWFIPRRDARGNVITPVFAAVEEL